MRYFILILTTILSQSLFAQQDTLRGESKTVEVSLKKARTANGLVQSFEKEKIDQLNANSVGDILKEGAGVQIKDYGGVGGLQTISIRSIGANHTGIIRNGLLVSNGSSGQINFGLIPAYSIEKLSLNVGQSEESLLPASAYRYANIISISTRSLSKEEAKFSGAIHVGYGSFETLKAGIDLKSSFKKGFVSIQSNVLKSKGNFPYTIPNSGSEEIYERLNANILRYQFESVVGFETKIGKSRLSYERNFTNQQLPGAVVLFVFNNQQYLKQSNDVVSLQHDYVKNDFSFSAQGSYSYQSTNYTDSIVFNTQGYINDKYFYSNLLTSVGFKYRIKKRYILFSSIDYDRGWLNSTVSTLDNPLRNQLLGVVGTQLYFPSIRGKLEGNVLLQGIKDERSLLVSKSIFKVNPYIGFGFFPSKKIDLRIRAFYKNNVRLPSFAEIYYSQIANFYLDPEEAHQLDVGVTYYAKTKKWLNSFMVRADVYQNFVRNKIVAIPTKDLFVWSIQNVDKVSITGVDITSSVNFKLHKRVELKLGASYSFQNALNKTDEEHITFNNQIAYVPKHTSNASFGVGFYGVSVNWMAYFTGTRYHLNENNQFNELASFWYNDLSISYGIKLKNRHRLQINFVLGNLSDERYEVVRSFPMMGRNFKIKLSYEFN